MTEETQSVESALNGLLRTVQNQLNNTLSLVEKQVPLVNAAMAEEAEDYNNIVGLLEAAEKEIEALKLHALSKETAHKSDLDAMQDEINTLNAYIGKLNIGLSGAATMEAELKKLKALNPDRLAKKNKELRKDLAEKSSLLTTASQNLKTTKNELRLANTQVGTLTRQNSEMIQEIDMFREQRKHQNGDVVQKAYSNNEDLTCYINVFEWGLTYRAVSIKALMVNDLKWHIEVRTSIGLGIIISITKWLMPFFPYVAEEVSDNWPTDLNADLVEIIVERCQTSHPHLVDRVDWASSTQLSEIEGINPKHLDLLNKSGFGSLFSVMSTPQERLAGLVKGMGNKSVAQVYEACNKVVEAWETENWTTQERFNVQ